MLNDLLKTAMLNAGLNPTDISREAKLNVVTIKRALEGDGKLSTYQAIASALGLTIKYVLESNNANN